MSDLLRAAQAFTNLQELTARGYRILLVHPEDENAQGPHAPLKPEDFGLTPVRDFRRRIEEWQRAWSQEREGADEHA